MAMFGNKIKCRLYVYHDVKEYTLEVELPAVPRDGEEIRTNGKLYQVKGVTYNVDQNIVQMDVIFRR